MELVEAMGAAKARAWHSVPGPNRETLQLALQKVGASIVEVWMEIEGCGAGGSGGAEEDGARHDARVERQERKPLPRSHFVDVWLERLPKPWLRTCRSMPWRP